MMPFNPTYRGAHLARLLALGLSLLVVGCGNPGTGPADIKWDRMACERCRMVLSDRLHSAQVRVREPDGRSKVLLFDDLGCAVLWLEDKAAKDDPATEIWVNDWRTGDWIDARTASYLTGRVTPMEYGLGAQSDPAPGALNLEQAREHIFAVERRYNAEGGTFAPATAPQGAAP